jgi:hypothetical protein
MRELGLQGVRRGRPTSRSTRGPTPNPKSTTSRDATLGSMHRRQQALLDDHDWLRRRYLADQVSLRAIAAQGGCSTSTVRRALRLADVATRSRVRRRRLRAVDAEQILRLVAGHGHIGAAQQLRIHLSNLYRDVRRLAKEERAAIRAHRLGTDTKDEPRWQSPAHFSNAPSWRSPPFPTQINPMAGSPTGDVENQTQALSCARSSSGKQRRGRDRAVRRVVEEAVAQAISGDPSPGAAVYTTTPAGPPRTR